MFSNGSTRRFAAVHTSIEIIEKSTAWTMMLRNPTIELQSISGYHLRTSERLWVAASPITAKPNSIERRTVAFWKTNRIATTRSFSSC